MQRASELAFEAAASGEKTKDSPVDKMLSPERTGEGGDAPSLTLLAEDLKEIGQGAAHLAPGYTVAEDILAERAYEQSRPGPKTTPDGFTVAQPEPIPQRDFMSAGERAGWLGLDVATLAGPLALGKVAKAGKVSKITSLAQDALRQTDSFGNVLPSSKKLASAQSDFAASFAKLEESRALVMERDKAAQALENAMRQGDPATISAAQNRMGQVLKQAGGSHDNLTRDALAAESKLKTAAADYVADIREAAGRSGRSTTELDQALKQLPQHAVSDVRSTVRSLDDDALQFAGEAGKLKELTRRDFRPSTALPDTSRGEALQGQAKAIGQQLEKTRAAGARRADALDLMHDPATAVTRQTAEDRAIQKGIESGIIKAPSAGDASSLRVPTGEQLTARELGEVKPLQQVLRHNPRELTQARAGLEKLVKQFPDDKSRWTDAMRQVDQQLTAVKQDQIKSLRVFGGTPDAGDIAPQGFSRGGRVASRNMLPKRSYCLTQMLPKSGRCLMIVLPKSWRHGYGRRDQHSHEDGGSRSDPRPVQGGVEERQDQDAQRVRGHGRLPQEARRQAAGSE